MKNKLLLLAIVGVLFMMSLLTGLSYAIWTVSGAHVVENSASVGCLEVAVREQTGTAINLKNTYPITDEQGAALTPFNIIISNTCSMTVNYQLNLEQQYTSDPIDSRFLKIKLNDNTPRILGTDFGTAETLESSSVESRTVDAGTLIKGQQKTFDVRLWVAESATVSDVGSKNYIGKFNVINTATETSFAVKFEPNGGTFDDGSTTAISLNKQLNKVYGTLPVVTLDGKTFDGWYTSLSGGTKITSETKFTTADNITLYARWID